MARKATRIVALSFIVAAVFASTARPVYAERYDIDPVETKTSYETKYLGFISVRGIFERMTGVLLYDRIKPPLEREAFIHVIIDTTTLRPTTFNIEAKREMLRGPEFFNVEKFPTIEFTSNMFRFENDTLIAIDGALSLTGTTRPVALIVRKSGCEPETPTRQARCTASADVVVKRSEYGMNGWAATVSDEVKIAVELVAVAVRNASTVPNTTVPANGPVKRAVDTTGVSPPNTLN